MEVQLPSVKFWGCELDGCPEHGLPLVQPLLQHLEILCCFEERFLYISWPVPLNSVASFADSQEA